MTRVALYARYSSDNQREASIEDQLRLCQEYAARERWQMVESYQDAAISGASTVQRRGIQQLLRDALAVRPCSTWCWPRPWTESAVTKPMSPRSLQVPQARRRRHRHAGGGRNL